MINELSNAERETMLNMPADDRSGWVDIPGYENLYLVNTMGEVMSMHSGKILKTRMTKGGYLYVNLYSRVGRKTHKIHALVALTFIGPRAEGLQINHKSGNKLDNRLSNLEYVTASENKLHAVNFLRRGIGEQHGRSKLYPNSISDIRKRLNDGESLASIGKRYGVTSGAISSIKQGRTWTHI